MDMTPLTNSVMELMDSLGESEAEIGLVVICVELKDQDGTWTRIYCNDGRLWLQEAFLEQSLNALTYEEKQDG